MDIRRELNAGENQIYLCKQYDIVPLTMAMILMHWDKFIILQRDIQLEPSRKHLWLGNYEAIDKVVHKWFNNARQHNVLLSGPIIQNKPQLFTTEAGCTWDISGFKASASLLYCFFQGNGIAWQVARGQTSRTKSNQDGCLEDDRLSACPERMQFTACRTEASMGFLSRTAQICFRLRSHFY